MDDVLAEEGNHVVPLSSATVTLSGFGEGIDGPRTVTRNATTGTWFGSWEDGWAWGSISISQGNGAWNASVSGAGEMPVEFTNYSASSTPPSNGWVKTYDEFNSFPDAAMSVGATSTTAWNTHWLLGDHQHSVRQVIDDEGKVQNKTDYDAAGNIVSETNVANASDYTWGGGRDGRTTGSIHMGLREYDPFSGTFHQPDPFGQYTNDRVFGGNNLIGMIDPSGGFAFNAGTGAAIGAGLGGMIGGPTGTTLGTAIGAAAGSWWNGVSSVPSTAAATPATSLRATTNAMTPAQLQHYYDNPRSREGATC